MEAYFKSRSRPLSVMESPGEERPPLSNLDAPVYNWPPAYNLFNFYQAPADADPWVPRGVIPESQHGRQRLGSVASPGAVASSLSGWQSTGPSEYDTLPPVPVPSDSGYETRENLSLFEGMDRSQDSQSIAGQMVDFNPFAGLSPHPLPPDMNMYGESWPHPTGPAVLDVQNVAPRNELVCHVCRKTVKTKSELAKHRQRHSKPHKCDVPGCPRQEGFSTPNDLDRHKRSLHPDLATAGPRYRCHLDQCHSKDKLWPRADNFRSHLKRVHNMIPSPDEDLIRFVVPSAPYTPDAQPVSQVHLEGVGSAMESSFPETGKPLNSALLLDHRSQSVHMQHVSTREPSSPPDLQAPQPALTVWDTAQAACETLDKPQSASDPVPNPDVTFCTSTVSQSPPHAPRTGPGRRASRMATAQPQLTLGTETGDTPEPRLNDTGNVAEEPAIGHRSSSQHAGESNHTDSGEMLSWGSKKAKEEVRALEADEESSDGDLQHQSSASPKNCESENQEDTALSVSEKCTISAPAAPAATRTETKLPSEMDMDDQALWALLNKVPKRMLERFVKESGLHAGRDLSASTGAATGSLHTCPICPKRFARKCELRKHQRRHDKPYSCTFPGCDKKFGSKNDWKRHENSQHYQLEVWRCDGQSTVSPETTRCGKVFPRRELLRQHLHSSHCAGGEVLGEEELDKCRVDRHWEPRFWCGFCSRIVDTHQKGLDGWAERFNHIDDHISGRNGLAKTTMAEWKSMEPITDTLDVVLSPPPTRPVGMGSNHATPAQAEEYALSQSFPTKFGKRKLHGDEREDEPRPKRTREENLMWTCCHCSMEDNAEFDTLCVSTNGCGHRCCRNCTMVEIKHG